MATQILLIALTVMITFCHSRLAEEHLTKQTYYEWKITHSIQYENFTQEQNHYLTFKTNLNLINKYNQLGRPFTLGLNKFGDITNDDFKSKFLGYKKATTIPQKISYHTQTTLDLPQALDWRKRGVVTPIKDQKTCMSCWAFSAVAAVEGAIKIKKGKLFSLSEQELLDCDKVDLGCKGGTTESAFEFIMETGLTTEEIYPYQGKVAATCHQNKTNITAASITGYGNVPSNDEDALLAAVAKQPISIAIDGDSFDFQFYSSGVFDGNCTTDLNHAVTVVGYGETEQEGQFWIVKNSWGENWGEDGFFRIKRNSKDKKGVCGLAMEASFPIV